ncbi:MAG: 50S ribosomal protein L5 [bacterium]
MLKVSELRLYQKYKQTVIPELIKIFGYKNIMQVPKIEKIVVNMGVGDATQNQDIIKKVYRQLSIITGQAPVVIKAKKSISNFKLRKGMNIGLKVTLRKQKMWAFLDKLISIVLPRIRDFKGVSNTSFDGRGNYNLGIKEQIIFPELSYDDIDKIRGLDINITTTAKTDKEAYELLRLLGMPFRKGG